MDWSPYLEKGETVRWQGRPAPRCFTFRNWKYNLFGLLLLFLSMFGMGFGLHLATGEWWAWLPLPFALAGLYLSLGQLFWSRLQWEGVFYAITDRRVIVHKILPQCVLFSPLSAVTSFQVRPLGAQLGTIRITADGQTSPLVLACVEHPDEPVALLRSVTEPRTP